MECHARKTLFTYKILSDIQSSAVKLLQIIYNKQTT